MKNEELLCRHGSQLNDFTRALRDECLAKDQVYVRMRNGDWCPVVFEAPEGEHPYDDCPNGGFRAADHSRYWLANGESITGDRFDLVEFDATLAASPSATPAPVASKPRLLGWRTDNYLQETAVKATAEMWEVHYTILPIFEGDPNTELVTPLY